MSREERALTQADTEEVFRVATKVLPEWYSQEIKDGMTDEALASALARVLGIWGGSCGPGRLDVTFQGSGLRIWGGWHFVNHHKEKPLFQGRTTLAMARLVYGIADPNEDQMSLF
jgi:hypothetical protein